MPLPQAKEPRNRVLRFHEFDLDAGKRELSRSGVAIPLSPKEFTTLQVLLEAGGQAVSRELLMQAAWPDTAVGDSSLARTISVLRRHLGTKAIKSVPKFGYRFEFPVTSGPAEAAAEVPAEIAPPLPTPAARSPRLTTHRLAGATLALTVLLRTGALLGLRRSHSAHRSAVAAHGTLRLAVLPLKNLSSPLGDTDAQRDALGGHLISRLGSLNPAQWLVLSEASTAGYLDTTKSAAEVGSELHEDSLLEGTVSFDADQVQLRLNLVNVSDQTTAWSRQFTSTPDQLPTIEDTVADLLATNPASITTASRHAHGTGSVQAHALYLQGRFELEQRTFDSYRRAEPYFLQAIALDPHYAEDFAALSETYIFMGGIIAENDCFPKARAAALKALRLNETSAEAHRNLAYVLMNDEANLRESQREYQRALELDPSDSRAHHWYAQLLAAQRHTEDSVHEAMRGYELDPRSVASGANYAFMLVQDGQAAQADQLLRRLLEREPNSDMTWGYLGFAEIKLAVTVRQRRPSTKRPLTAP